MWGQPRQPASNIVFDSCSCRIAFNKFEFLNQAYWEKSFFIHVARERINPVGIKKIQFLLPFDFENISESIAENGEFRTWSKMHLPPVVL